MNLFKNSKIIISASPKTLRSQHRDEGVKAETNVSNASQKGDSGFSEADVNLPEKTPPFRAGKFILVILLLSIIPFFWLRPGEMDLGGDSGRLYFYDSLTLIRTTGFYSIVPYGLGDVESNTFYLPIFALFAGLKYIFQSPNILISVFNTIKIVVGFVSVYLILKMIFGKKDALSGSLKEVSAILGGLFYIFSPMFIGNFDRALLTQNQVFLNPLVFYLLLKYFLEKQSKYLWLILMISFVFAFNFSWAAAPPLLAFYPLSTLFIALYTKYIRKKALPLKGVGIAILIFLGLHAFHVLPTILVLFNSDSNISTRIFSNSNILDYFYGILSIARVSVNLFSYSELKQFGFLSIIIPFIVLFGLLLNTKNQKTILLTGVFFLITLYLIAANITYTGVLFYAKLFQIPGFNMFRNFIGQWQFVFYFFYALLFGQSLYLIFLRLSKKKTIVLSLATGIILVISAWPFINGSFVNKVYFQSNGVRYAIVMDTKYEETLAYLKSLPDDSKILTLPFTDCCYQVIHGTNNGAYIGMSTISYLGGKKDFSGYNIIAPFSDVFLKLSKEKNYASIKRLLSILNIRYIFYNQDPEVYDKTFPDVPYRYVRQFLPNDQKGYKEFVSNITNEKIYERGHYGVYEVNKTTYLPHFYIATEVTPYENTVNDWYGKTESFFVDGNDADIRTAYAEKNICIKIFSEELCKQKMFSNKLIPPKITIEKINPTKYRLKVFDAKDPYVLIFSEKFHKNWKVFVTNNKYQQSKTVQSYFNGEITEGLSKDIFLERKTFETWGKEAIAKNRHFQVNGYANAWYIKPEDVKGRSDYDLIIEMTEQRAIYIGLAITAVVFTVYIAWGFLLFLKKNSQTV